ncbi:hypothetical protein C7M84_007633, partial [Penaeus vannamei]
YRVSPPSSLSLGGQSAPWTLTSACACPLSRGRFRRGSSWSSPPPRALQTRLGQGASDEAHHGRLLLSRALQTRLIMVVLLLKTGADEAHHGRLILLLSRRFRRGSSCRPPPLEALQTRLIMVVVLLSRALQTRLIMVVSLSESAHGRPPLEGASDEAHHGRPPPLEGASDEAHHGRRPPPLEGASDEAHHGRRPPLEGASDEASSWSSSSSRGALQTRTLQTRLIMVVLLLSRALQTRLIMVVLLLSRALQTRLIMVVLLLSRGASDEAHHGRPPPLEGASDEALMVVLLSRALCRPPLEGAHGRPPLEGAHGRPPLEEAHGRPPLEGSWSSEEAPRRLMVVLLSRRLMVVLLSRRLMVVLLSRRLMVVLLSSDACKKAAQLEAHASCLGERVKPLVDEIEEDELQGLRAGEGDLRVPARDPAAELVRRDRPGGGTDALPDEGRGHFRNAAGGAEEGQRRSLQVGHPPLRSRVQESGDVVRRFRRTPMQDRVPPMKVRAPCLMYGRAWSPVQLVLSYLLPRADYRTPPRIIVPRRTSCGKR